MALESILEKRVENFLARMESQSCKEKMLIEFYLKSPNLGLKGSESIENPRIKEGLEKFKTATSNKLFAQELKFITDEREALEKICVRTISAYMDVISTCSEEEKSIGDERLRRIFIMDAYESIGDILLLQRRLGEGVYSNAITMYTELKKQAIDFLEWGKSQKVQDEDIAEAKNILFNAEMSLASLYICCQDLEKSCEETLQALELIKSLNNKDGIDYSEYIPFKLRTASYATKRFSEVNRNNQEQPYEPIMGENPLLRFSDKPEYRYKFLRSIMHRRIMSNSSIMAGLFYAQFKSSGDDSNSWDFKKYGPKFIFEDIATDPTNDKGYRALFFLERSPHPEDQELAKTAIKVSRKIRLKKAEIGHFEMVQVHPNYSDVLTDGEVLFKKEPNEDTAKKHVAILKFLSENSGLDLPGCELCEGNNGNHYVKLQLAKNPANGKIEREFSACTLEDMTTLYKAEVDRKQESTPKEMAEFRKKKLKQAINVMLKFSSADQGDRNLPKSYGLDIQDYEYETQMREKILKRVTLDEKIQSQVIQVTRKLGKLKRALCHCDFHPGNILDAGKEGLVIIDPISAAYANRFFDLAYLLEQADIELSKDDKTELIGYFTEQLRAKGEEIINPQEQYDLNAAFVNLKLAGVCEKWAKEGKGEEYLKRKEIYLSRFNELASKL